MRRHSRSFRGMPVRMPASTDAWPRSWETSRRLRKLASAPQLRRRPRDVDPGSPGGGSFLTECRTYPAEFVADVLPVLQRRVHERHLRRVQACIVIQAMWRSQKTFAGKVLVWRRILQMVRQYPVNSLFLHFSHHQAVHNRAPDGSKCKLRPGHDRPFNVPPKLWSFLQYVCEVRLERYASSKASRQADLQPAPFATRDEVEVDVEGNGAWSPGIIVFLGDDGLYHVRLSNGTFAFDVEVSRIRRSRRSRANKSSRGDERHRFRDTYSALLTQKLKLLHLCEPYFQVLLRAQPQRRRRPPSAAVVRQRQNNIMIHMQFRLSDEALQRRNLLFRHPTIVAKARRLLSIVNRCTRPDPAAASQHEHPQYEVPSHRIISQPLDRVAGKKVSLWLRRNQSQRPATAPSRRARSSVVEAAGGLDRRAFVELFQRLWRLLTPRCGPVSEFTKAEVEWQNLFTKDGKFVEKMPAESDLRTLCASAAESLIVQLSWVWGAKQTVNALTGFLDTVLDGLFDSHRDAESGKMEYKWKRLDDIAPIWTRGNLEERAPDPPTRSSPTPGARRPRTAPAPSRNVRPVYFAARNRQRKVAHGEKYIDDVSARTSK